MTSENSYENNKNTGLLIRRAGVRAPHDPQQKTAKNSCQSPPEALWKRGKKGGFLVPLRDLAGKITRQKSDVLKGGQHVS